MKRRMLPLLLALCMVFTLLPGSVFAAKSDTDIAYAIPGGTLYFDASTGTITGASGNANEFDIPAEIEGVPVTGIGDRAFYDRSLMSVIIPDSVTSIGEDAFTGCMNIENMILSNNLTSIGKRAFAGCCCLPYLTIPSSLTSIGDSAFMSCDSLANIYYAGSEAQWNAITIGSGNQSLTNAKVHYNTVIIDPTTVFTDVTDNWIWDGIAYCYSLGLMNGVSDTEFDPDGTLTRAMVATVLWRLAGKPTATKDCSFTDLGSPNDPGARWYLDAVAWAAEAGVVRGRNANSYDPNGAITRQELATMLYRYAQHMGFDTSARGSLAVFPDEYLLSPYAEKAMIWATGVSLINGNKIGNTVYLDPLGNATRAQVATILMRFCKNVAQ